MNLILRIIRNAIKTQKIRFKSAFNIFRKKEIDKDNFDKFFDSRSNNLFQVAII